MIQQDESSAGGVRLVGMPFHPQDGLEGSS